MEHKNPSVSTPTPKKKGFLASLFGNNKDKKEEDAKK
jgi:hypothetical protein